MKIEYLGHSCFKLTESTGTSIVCDPYNELVGYTPHKLICDAVTISHHHFDHDAIGYISGSPTIIDKVGCCALHGVEIKAIKSFHDSDKGAKRGSNLIFKFRMDGIDVCHLGDLGEHCSSKLINELLPVNVLMIPVGGTYTLDCEMAKEYVDRIMPDLVIPMHYRDNGCKIDIDKVDDFVNLFVGEHIEECVDSEISLQRSDLKGNTKILILKRKLLNKGIEE